MTFACLLIVDNEQVPQIGDDKLHCTEWMVDIPCAAPRDSHFAKLAMPLATWASTSGCRDRTMPRSARIPPSSLSFSCSLSGIHPQRQPTIPLWEVYQKTLFKALPTWSLFSYKLSLYALALCNCAFYAIFQVRNIVGANHCPAHKFIQDKRKMLTPGW